MECIRFPVECIPSLPPIITSAMASITSLAEITSEVTVISPSTLGIITDSTRMFAISTVMLAMPEPMSRSHSVMSADGERAFAAELRLAGGLQERDGGAVLFLDPGLALLVFVTGHIFTIKPECIALHKGRPASGSHRFSLPLCALPGIWRIIQGKPESTA